MTSRIVLSMIFAASFSAMAEGNGSQYQWQTPVDKMELTAELGYSMATSKATSGNKTDYTTFGQKLKFEYGLTEMFSTGLKLWNASTDVKPPNNGAKTKQSGLHDLDLFLNGRSAMGGGSLRYGTDLYFALGKSKTENNGDMNNASGGLALAPFVGYEMTSDACTFGARLSYMMYLGDRKEDVTSNNVTAENKLSGSATTKLALFYEHDMKPMTLGAALEFSGTENEKSKDSAGTTTTTGGNSAYNIRLYAPYEVASNIIVLPEFNYNSLMAKPNGIDSYSGWGLNVGGRFQF